MIQEGQQEGRQREGSLQSVALRQDFEDTPLFLERQVVDSRSLLLALHLAFFFYNSLSHPSLLARRCPLFL